MSLKSAILVKTMMEIGSLPRDLGNGLVLRVATSDDVEQLARFNGWIHGPDHVGEAEAAWTRDFMSPAHPSCGPSNVFLVEDTRAGKVVSTMCMFPQTWTYAGIPIPVGRPEAVGTDPEYRRRGLVRALFEVVHAKSASMGHLVQGITGIPWFYRQFGYEYALDMARGRVLSFSAIPRLKEGEPERYVLRPMREDDLAWVATLYERDTARSLVACPRTDRLWRYLLSGYSPQSFESKLLRVIETEAGRPVGYVAAERELTRFFPVRELAVVDGESVRAIMPSVLRALELMARTEADAQKKTVEGLAFTFEREHPAFEAIPEYFEPARLPYAWYLRVPDLPALLKRIAPALEARLARSALAGHTGEIRIDEYVRGTKIAFERGKIVMIEPWDNSGRPGASAGFPPFVFLQLIFGFRSLVELQAAFPDCLAEDEAAVLLGILFPRQSSCLRAIA